MGKNFFERIADWINGSPDATRADEIKAKRPRTKKTTTRKDTKSNTKDIVSDKHGVKSVTAGAIYDKSTKKRASAGKKNISKPVESKNGGKYTATNNVPGQNPIEKKDNLINAIIALLQKNYRGEQFYMEDKVLSVFILDSIFYDSIQSTDFKSVLESAIKDELGLSFNRIEIKGHPLPSNEDTTVLFSEVQIGIKSMQTPQTIRRAIIRSVANNGSTIEPEYYLDSEKIMNRPNSRYNIGAGLHPIMSDNSHRKNDIAIDDNPDSIEYEKNKYVSRAHANISFSEKHGFILHVEFGGTRAAQKRTYIYRGNEKIELDNILVPVPLKDGDYIVLSKYVHLLFEEA